MYKVINTEQVVRALGTAGFIDKRLRDDGEYIYIVGGKLYVEYLGNRDDYKEITPERVIGDPFSLKGATCSMPIGYCTKCGGDDCACTASEVRPSVFAAISETCDDLIEGGMMSEAEKGNILSLTPRKPASEGLSVEALEAEFRTIEEERERLSANLASTGERMARINRLIYAIKEYHG